MPPSPCRRRAWQNVVQSVWRADQTSSRRVPQSVIELGARPVGFNLGTAPGLVLLSSAVSKGHFILVSLLPGHKVGTGICQRSENQGDVFMAPIVCEIIIYLSVGT